MKHLSLYHQLTCLLFCVWFSTQAQSQTIEVTDNFGRLVRVEKPVTRIISLAPHITENLFSAGAGDKVIGIVEYSDYPAATKTIPSVGSYAQFSIETILAMKPDLVVAWRGGNNSEALDQLERLGLTLYYSEPRSFDDIINNIHHYAALADSRDTLDPRVHEVKEHIAQSRDEFANSERVDVFYQVWSDPLMTLNGEHFISRVLEVCGARNLFADLPIIAPRVEWEAVIEANPHAIVMGQNHNVPADTSLWEKWTMVDAVKNNHFVFVHSDTMHRHTLRMLLAIGGFCDQIHEVRESRAR